jgi:hypothetical protein
VTALPQLSGQPLDEAIDLVRLLPAERAHLQDVEALARH